MVYFRSKFKNRIINKQSESNACFKTHFKSNVFTLNNSKHNFIVNSDTVTYFHDEINS